MNDRLKNKVAIVTGGSLGIGIGISTLFAKEGAKVIVSSRNLKDINNVVNKINDDGGEASGIVCDITSSEQVKVLVSGTIKKYGRIDVLANNAGKNPDRLSTAEDLTEQEWDDYFNVNAKGAWLCSKYVIPEMRKSGGGSIIMTSSVSAHYAQSFNGCYNASKAAMDILAKCMALDFAKDNIRVNSICPAWVATQNNKLEELEGKVFEKPLSTGVKSYKEIVEMHPIGRIGNINDIGWMAVYLASDESSWVTGVSYMLDGGYTCR